MAWHVPAAATPNRPPLGDRSALHFAAERGNREVLELLIAGGAKVGCWAELSHTLARPPLCSLSPL